MQQATAAMMQAEAKAITATGPTQSAAAATLAQNAKQGAAAENMVAGELAAEGKLLGTRVSVNTSEGRRVLDNLAQEGGNLVNVEVKSGAATRTATQVAKDNAMATEGGTIVGKNAPANLRGQKVKIETQVRQVKKEEIKQ
jgi:hypothetical protein